MIRVSFALLFTASAALVQSAPCRAQPFPLVKNGHWDQHYIPFCIHEDPTSNGYVGNCVQAGGDDVDAEDFVEGIKEAAQNWNRHGLADVEFLYTGSCGALSWPADDPSPGNGNLTACDDVSDVDGVSEIGCSADWDVQNYNGYFCRRSTALPPAGPDGNLITEFSIWLNPAKDWTRDITGNFSNIVSAGNLIDRTITHEFGHALGLRHVTGPGNTCDDASLLCSSTDDNVFLLHSDIDVLVNDSVSERPAAEDAEGWNWWHELRAWSVDDGQTTWASRTDAFGVWPVWPEWSLIPPAIGNRLGSSWYMVAWSRPGDQGALRVAIGDGSASSWTSSVLPSSQAKSFYSPSIARRSSDGRWILVWRSIGWGFSVPRTIFVQDNYVGLWGTVRALSLGVSAWQSPTVAYHEASDRFILGWVHSGSGGSKRFARFRTRPANDDAAVWSPMVEVWADENSNGTVELGENVVPWGSFDLDCSPALNGRCQLAYIQTDNDRRLSTFQIDVGPNGEISYVPGSRQEIDPKFSYANGAGIAINPTGPELRAMGLRARVGDNQYNYPVYKTRRKIGATWTYSQFFNQRDSSGAAAFTFSEFNDEWMSVNLEGDPSNDP